MEIIIFCIFFCYYSFLYLGGIHIRNNLIVCLIFYSIGIIYFFTPMPKEQWEIIAVPVTILVFVIQVYFVHKFVFLKGYNYFKYIIIVLLITAILIFVNLFILLLLGFVFEMEGL